MWFRDDVDDKNRFTRLKRHSQKHNKLGLLIETKIKIKKYMFSQNED